MKTGARIMGILNVTPDSFSDGGLYASSAAAIARGRHMLDEGADIIDIGGESTRPGAQPLPVDQEIARVLPVIAALKPYAIAAKAWLSIDTRNAATMTAALAAGIDMINDVSALSHDSASLAVAAGSQANIVLMHMQGTPETMQRDPVYGDVTTEVCAWLADRARLAMAAGIDASRIILDPGIGFGKTTEHNIALLRNLGVLQALGYRVMLGVSRKGFIGKLSADEPPAQRLGGSLAAGLYGLEQGVDILRVHDIAETVQAWRILQTLIS